MHDSRNFMSVSAKPDPIPDVDNFPLELLELIRLETSDRPRQAKCNKSRLSIPENTIAQPKNDRAHAAK